ncbi:MAG: hypothetical protein HZC26_02750 [Candidatus Magasanikbacteria bacterium]|nr:hypothetical protein [Candidatus Magasanikbacteria bacterium]
MKAIRKVPDTHFMWALALLDLATDFGQSVVERFPEYFTEEQRDGLVPWSVLRKWAREHGSGPGSRRCAHNFLHQHGAIDHFNLPVLWFVHQADEYEKWREKSHGHNVHLTTDEIARVQTVGEVAEWQGKKIVLVETIYTES